MKFLEHLVQGLRLGFQSRRKNLLDNVFAESPIRLELCLVEELVRSGFVRKLMMVGGIFQNIDRLIAA